MLNIRIDSQSNVNELLVAQTVEAQWGRVKTWELPVGSLCPPTTRPT
jgi:hypothetical protein